MRVAASIALALILGLTVAAEAQDANTISVPINGLRNSKGAVRCGLFNSANGFPKPGQQVLAATTPIANQKATCVFTTIPPGTYAVVVFHAENNETGITTNMLGIPKQGYGFSRNPSTLTGAPAFADSAQPFTGAAASWPITLTYR
jgi:uncharacterized protein (DUF2141 family)